MSYGESKVFRGESFAPTQEQACKNAETEVVEKVSKYYHGLNINMVFQESSKNLKLEHDGKLKNVFYRKSYFRFGNMGSVNCEVNVSISEEKEPETKKPHQKGDFLITVGGGQGFYQESDESYKYSNRELDFHWNYFKFGFGEFDFENERRDAKAKSYTYFLFGLGFHQLQNSFIYGISFDGVFPNQRKSYFPQASIFAGIFPVPDTPLFLALSLALQIREEVETKTILKLGVAF
jgi:hypothetical protein